MVFLCRSDLHHAEQTEVVFLCRSDLHHVLEFDDVLIPLFQVTKLIEESTVSKTVKNAIDTDKLLDWLVENSVLSIALEGN